jgi:hypothetical protein
MMGMLGYRHPAEFITNITAYAGFSPVLVAERE